ncbi:unnamed protein product [Ranitomeya imitator]|uniref:Reverse transcriptase/retrotransposon-derived protein RNase H-like domain-containing protein n=1 Tax=Ranitomeya imitator TaxID=111125 RepID=A0ABN9M1A1_9NEOB|nr:unnamed protein product [Ranitomeya imitator]
MDDIPSLSSGTAASRPAVPREFQLSDTRCSPSTFSPSWAENQVASEIPVQTAFADMITVDPISVLVSFVVIYISGQCFKNQKKSIHFPPGPMPLPIIGNMHVINTLKPQKSFTEMSKKYGPIFTVYLGAQRLVVLCGYDMVKDALVNHAEEFAGRPYTAIGSKVSDKHVCLVIFLPLDLWVIRDLDAGMDVQSLCSRVEHLAARVQSIQDYDVFDEPKSSSLPPHRDCDCAIDLIPGCKFPKGRLFNLSVPEHAAMRSYVKESLEKGIKGACWFTKIDLRAAYNLIRIKQEMDPVKVQAIHDWIQPTSVKCLQKFLGFANFYRRFIANFSSVVKPLTDLTKKGADVTNWSSEAVEAFQELKRRFTSAPVLRQPDVSLPFQVEVDASEIGAGAVLSQRNSDGSLMKPCAFFSRKFSPAERNYDVGNRELLALKWAFEEWRHWLEGAKHRICGQVEPSECPGVDSVMDRLQQIWTHVVDNLTLSQEKAQRFANRCRSNLSSINAGILFSNGENWRVMRRFTLSTLRDYGMGRKDIENKITEECDCLLQKLRSYGGKPFNNQTIINAAVANIIVSILLDHRYEYDDPTILKLMNIVNDTVTIRESKMVRLYNSYPSLVGWLPGNHRKLNKNHIEMQNFVSETFTRKRRELDVNNQRNLIDAFLAKQQEV